jgi:MFS family permease
MIFKKGELKHLWVFYTYHLLFGFSSMILPFLVIYFINIGLSFFQIAVFIATSSITMFLFEIPTGAFADSFGRKKSVVLGFLIIALAVFCIPLTNNFSLLVISWFFIGLGNSFANGAEESWVVDNLNRKRRKDLHQEFFIKSISIMSFGAIFAPFIGALIVESHSMKYLWFVFSIVFFINALFILIFGKEYFKPKKVNLKKNFKQTIKILKKGFSFTFKHRTILLLILGGVFFTLMGIARDGWQPLLVNLGLLEHQLGYVYSILALFSMILPFGVRLFHKIKPKNTISIIILIRMALLFSVIFLVPELLFLAIIIFIFSDSLYVLKDPVLQTYFHKFIPSKMRATVVSIKSTSVLLITAIGTLIAGLLLDSFGPQNVIPFVALLGIIAIILFQKIKD